VSMCHAIMMSSRNIAVEMHDLEQYHDGLFVCSPPCYCVFLPSMTTEMASRCSISLGGCLSSKATLIRRQHEKVCKAYRYAAVVVVGIVAVKVAPAAVVVAAAAVAAAHLLFCDISGGSSSSSSGSNSSSTTSNGSSSSGGSGSSRSR
jgi:uncharacterized membrane protein YgcG